MNLGQKAWIVFWSFIILAGVFALWIGLTGRG